MVFSATRVLSPKIQRAATFIASQTCTAETNKKVKCIIYTIFLRPTAKQKKKIKREKESHAEDDWVIDSYWIRPGQAIKRGNAGGRVHIHTSKRKSVGHPSWRSREREQSWRGVVGGTWRQGAFPCLSARTGPACGGLHADGRLYIVGGPWLRRYFYRIVTRHAVSVNLRAWQI